MYPDDFFCFLWSRPLQQSRWRCLSARPGVTRWRTERGLVAVREGHNSTHKTMAIDIIQIAKECPGTILAVRADDLVETNNRLIEMVRSDLERAIAEKREITYMTREMVMEKLNIVPSTLWRWQKRGYLVPIKVGGENRYKSTDIDDILEGRR